MPDKGADPIVAAAQLVLGLQTIVSRRLSPLDSAVVSITQFNAGEAINGHPGNRSTARYGALPANPGA